MARIIIRTHARGPLGFVRLATEDADAGITYAAVRSAIAEQLFEGMPGEAAVFRPRDGGRFEHVGNVSPEAWQQLATDGMGTTN